MILTKELLKRYNACKEGIDFCERNKLFGFDLDRMDEIKGDYDGFIEWLKMPRLLDSNGNIIKQEYPYGYWTKWEYDDKGNMIMEEDSDGSFIIMQYNSNNNNMIKLEYSDGGFITWEYDLNGNRIREDNSNGNWAEWKYDDNGNLLKDEDYIGLKYSATTELYPNGQLKRIDDLYIPLI